MNPLSEIALLVARELRRNFRSAKGLVLLSLCALMAAGAALALVGAEHAADDFARQGKRGSGVAMTVAGAEATRKLIEAMYGENVADRLASVPKIVLTMVAGAVIFAPSFIALLSFDSVSAELQFRGIRYWTVRMRRSSYFVGKVLGVFLVAATATLLAQAIAWTIAVTRGTSPAVDTLSWGLILWVNMLPIALAWCSLAVFVSALVRAPIVALMINFACNLALWIAWLSSRVRDRHREEAALWWIYPNNADRYLLSNDPKEIALGLGVCVGFAAVFWIGGVALMQQRDV